MVVAHILGDASSPGHPKFGITIPGTMIDYDETFDADDARNPPEDRTDWDEEDEDDYEGGIPI
jgi:hypothetical protein